MMKRELYVEWLEIEMSSVCFFEADSRYETTLDADSSDRVRHS